MGYNGWGIVWVRVIIQIHNWYIISSCEASETLKKEEEGEENEDENDEDEET